jgi:uncharacterized membrane protein
VTTPAAAATARTGQPLAAPDLRPESGNRLRALVPHLPVVVLMAAYTVYFGHLTVAVHRGYGTPAYDMGIFDQGIWLLSRFKAPFVTVMGRNLFGDHTSFILLLLVPVYWVYPHAAVLLVVQSGLIALGALPVYLLARQRLASTLLATVLAGAFLLHPALQWGNLEQFHPEAFLVPLIGLAIYAAVTWRPGLLIAAVALSLLVKEDVALFVVPLGVWVAFRRDRAFGWRMVAAAVAYSVFATEVVIRSLLGVATLYSDRIPFGGIGGLVGTALRHPARLARYLRSDSRPMYVWRMIAPSALVFLRAPEVAAVGLLVLVSNVISNFPYQHQIQYHYSMAVVPLLAMGTVFAIGALSTFKWRAAAVTAVGVCSVWACFLWGVLPFSLTRISYWQASDPRVRDINAVEAALPHNAVVSAYYPYVSHIDHRTRVYMWPNPFRAEYWGQWKQEGQRLHFAGEVQYVLVPTHFDDASDQATFDQIRSEYDVVRRVGDVELLKQAGPVSADR